MDKFILAEPEAPPKHLQIAARLCSAPKAVKPLVSASTAMIGSLSPRIAPPMPIRHRMVSTTANIYAHVMEAADKKNADILADVFLKKA